MKVIGLTGRSGSGKSTLAGALGKLGAAVLDGDRIAAELMIPGSPILHRVVEAFGYEYLTPYGQLDRKSLGKQVFCNKEALKRLNSIVHPAFRGRTAAVLEELRRGDGKSVLAVIDAAVLFEAGLDSLCDMIVAVMCDEDTMADRISKREGVGKVAALARIAAQKACNSDYGLLSRADIVVFSRRDAREMEAWAKRIMRIAGGA